MCTPCYEDTKRWNAAKHEASRIAVVPDGMKMCRSCKNAKPIEEFAVDPKMRKPHLRGEPGALCLRCRVRCRRRAVKIRADQSPEKKAVAAAKKKVTHRDYRDLLLAAYGNACKCCGETTNEFLAIDHVNNDGKEHRQITGFNKMTQYRWAKKNGFPSTMQVLCHNCNQAKAFYGICPHQTQPLLLVKSPA